MNKIYKVIWSKVRNCYVAVSEIAKRNGKSCTSVNCGAKVNRGHAGVALAIALSLSMTGGGVAWGAEVVEVSDATYPEITTDTTSTAEYYKLVMDGGGTAGSGVKFTVGNGGKINYVTSVKSGNTIEIKSGGEVAGYQTLKIDGKNHDVSIYAGNQNNVVKSAGVINQSIIGGINSGLMVTNNSVTISGGSVGGNVYGGVASYTQYVRSNSVEISGGTVNGNVYGGYSLGTNLQGGISLPLLNNTITIRGGTVKGVVYGAYSNYNQVSGTDVDFNVKIVSGIVEGTVIGGVAMYKDATYNKVTVTGGTIKEDVAGGYSKEKNTTYNKVTVTGGTINGEVYGGYVDDSTGYASNNTVTISGISTIGLDTTKVIVGGRTNSGSATLNTVDINLATNGKINGTIYGGYSNSGTVTKNTVTISGGTVTSAVYGGYSVSGTAGGTDNNKNTVTITGGTVNDRVYGGYSGSGDALYNQVIISGATATINGNVYGGYSNNKGSDAGNANYNTVKIENGARITGDVYGGFVNANATNSRIMKYNTVTLGGATITKWLRGGLSSDGNKLILASTGNAVGNFTNFETVELSNTLAWGNGTTVLTGEVWTPLFTYFDISGATNLSSTSNNYGKMTLLEDTNTSSHSLNDHGFTLKYKQGSSVTEATISTTYPRAVVVTGTAASTPSNDKGVSLAYNQKAHIVSLNKAGTSYYKKVMYSVADNVTGITFGNMTWGTPRNGTVSGTHFDFGGVTNTNITTTGLTFKNPESITKDATTSLLTNATNLAAGTNISHSQSITDYNIGNGVKLNATLKGNVVRTTAGQIGYKSNGTTLNSVNIAGWNGTDPATVSSDWLKSGYVTVTIGDSFSAPSLSAGATPLNILTSSNTFFGDNTIIDNTNNDKYHSFDFTGDTTNHVTFAGTQSKGVKASDDHKSLVYAVDKKNVSTITLGGMSWGTGRTPGSESDVYNFSTVTGVDASGLTFTFTDTQAGELQIGSNMTLLSGATGLPAGVEPSYGGEKTSHSQSVPYSAANSVTLTGTLTGTVATKAEAGVDKVTYTALGMTLNSINLAGWNSSTEAPFVPAGWTNQLGNNSITADGFTGPTLAAGESRVILQATTEGYFNDDQITGGKKNATTGLTEDTAKGVTFAGNHLSGGVKADANGTKLAYYAEAKDVSGIKLGNVAWNDGRPAETLYVFNNVTTVDATDLLITFANESDKGSLSNTSTTTLVSNATGLPDSVAVNYKNSASNHTQEISYNITNGVSMTGTLTGTIASGTVSEKKALVYSVSGMTLDSINLAGWDSSIAATAVPAGWTNQLGNNSITAEGFDEPALALGQSLDILTATTEGYFNDDQLTGGKKYSTSSLADDTVNGVTLSGTHYGGVKAEDNGKKLTYYAETMDVTGIALGNMTWGTTTGRTASGLYIFNNVSSVNASGLSFTNPDEVSGSMELLSGATDLAANKMVTGADHSQSFDKAMTNGVSLSSTLKGTVSTTAAVVKYTATGTTVNSVNLAGWDGTAASSVPDGWALAAGATIETDGMTIPTVEAGKHIDILQSNTDNFFANVPINGDNAYGKTQYTFMESDTAKSVTIAGTQDKGVTLNTEKKHLIYKAGTLDVASVTLGPVEWKKGATVFDRSGAGYNYAGVAALGTDGFAISYASPETVATGDSMTLLQANATLKDMAEQVKQTSYSFAPVSGVTVDAAVTGSLEAKGGNVTYTATANQASKLTFGSVDWKDSGALMTRPSNITFAGADVDTTKIHFQNVKELDANRKMTLVSDFGDSVGTITGTKYTVGAGLEGEGAASLSGSDLIFTTKTGARDLAALAQTHNTLMVMEAGMAVLAAGNEHVGQAMAELGNTQNAAVDGTVTAASLGGSKSRYKTGSHVDSNNWNVAVAVGSKRELKKGSLEWGVFGEYGKSNYTLHSDAGRGDGDSHYAGGGLMAKWTNKHDVYTEASVRLGRLNDTASNLLRDAAGNSYGYDVHANYFGAHVGIGKIIHYKGGKSLDVYGKYFYTKRDGVDFTSGGNNYSLDSVASSILRVGARYGTTDKKWNWYGGLAYEYEFDGKSEGTVDGVRIRAASVKGGSVRGEIGLRMSATKTNPWQTDISIYGYGGKHRGFGGSVNVAYMF